MCQLTFSPYRSKPVDDRVFINRGFRRNIREKCARCCALLRKKLRSALEPCADKACSKVLGVKTAFTCASFCAVVKWAAGPPLGVASQPIAASCFGSDYKIQPVLVVADEERRLRCGPQDRRRGRFAIHRSLMLRQRLQGSACSCRCGSGFNAKKRPCPASGRVFF